MHLSPTGLTVTHLSTTTQCHPPESCRPRYHRSAVLTTTMSAHLSVAVRRVRSHSCGSRQATTGVSCDGSRVRAATGHKSAIIAPYHRADRPHCCPGGRRRHRRRHRHRHRLRSFFLGDVRPTQRHSTGITGCDDAVFVSQIGPFGRCEGLFLRTTEVLERWGESPGVESLNS